MLRPVKILLLLLVLVVYLVDSPDAYPDLLGDLNEDRIVDSKDLRIFSFQWLDPGCLVLGCKADLDDVDGVNMFDLALLAGNWQVLEPHLVISEFMAKNCGTLLDGNGEPSGWIEIYNPSLVSINLDGWYLIYESDDSAMWQFPEGLQLAPGEFLIVFASKKTFEENPFNYPYLDTLGYHHTNFGLDESEGYLALLAPDGDTIIHEYPQYPEQLTDVSYGLAQYATTLVPAGAIASYYVPDSNDALLGTGWTAVDFNDSTWDTGPTGLGFGSSVSGGVATDVEGDMLGRNASLLVRIEFEVEDAHVFDTLALRMKYEDGFAAHLNGYRVTMRNSPDPLWWNSTALSNRTIEDALVFDEINLTTYLNLLQTGRNMLAIHGLNDDKSDGEFLILPELVAARYTHIPQYFISPTPGTFNVAGETGIVEKVWFSHKRGFYDSPFHLILSNGTDGAEIRYTDDGSLPTITNGLTYNPLIDPPIEIDRTTTIRAVAVKPGYINSKVETFTYIFLDEVIQQPTNPEGFPTNWGHTGSGDYEMDPEVVTAYSSTVKNDLKAVPTLSLAMDVNDWFGSGGQGIYLQGAWCQRAVSAEFIGNFCDDEEENCWSNQINCSVMIADGSSVNRWKMDKLSMGLVFDCTYGPSKLSFPLFGDKATNEFKTLVLNARMNNSWAYGGSVGINRPGLGQRDIAQYTRNQFVSDIQNAMGGFAPHGRYVHLYLNGLYWGLYCLHERPDEYFAASYFGGEAEDYDGPNYDDEDGIFINGSLTNYNEMFSIANAGLASYSQYQLIQQYLDVPNLIDYIITNFYIGNTDWDHHNWSASRSSEDPTSRWRYHSWNAEHVMEGLNDDVTGKNNSGKPTRLHQQLEQNAEYKLLFADHIHRHFFNNGVLTPEGATELYNMRLNEVDRAVVGESARWGDNHRTTPYTRDIEWITERNWLLNTYFPQRTAVVLNQLKNRGLYPDVNAPVFYVNGSYQHGGEISTDDELTINNPNASGTIYYTLDGSDPRQPVTGNPVGTLYTGPITLNKSTNVKARVLDGGTWSALNEATFAVGPVADYLRITEIMFHPRYMGNINDPNKEYIELKNIGPNTLNINLVKFTEGIYFTFPDVNLASGEHIVVVKNVGAFEAKYGTCVKIAGVYTGSLDEDDERIRLEDAIGRTILDFEYRDRWYPITDGDGFSLTIIDPTDNALYGGDQGLFAHWKFDDGSGSTAIDSAGSNHGILHGDPNWTTGRIGGALNFDGDGDYVAIDCVDALAGNNLTAQAWIRTSEYAGIWNPVLIQHDANNNGYYFYVGNDKPSFYIVEYSNFVEARSFETINTDQWYHVAATNDGSSLKLYVDGLLKAVTSSVGLTVADCNNAYIGFEHTTPLYYHGLIDDVRIYNRPVSESEFQDMAEPMRRWSRKSSWRPSVYRNGTPGWDDSGILPNPGDVVINEVLSHSDSSPDWIELHNTTNKTINIGGWFLSDDDRDEPNLMKYRIADGTMIDPNDYVVFYEDTDFKNMSDPGCLVPFAFYKNGEEACLSSHLDPNCMLTGYRQVQALDAAQANVPFGRYFMSSTGTFDFVAMDYNTPDANNAYPKVGPIVINEIMYNPLSGNQNEEYIELHNITGALVTLYRYDKSTPWKFTDGIDYTFSSGPPVTIPPYGYLILAKDLTAFTARYGGMPPGVQVLDGYSGRLSNAGERLQIDMPGDIDAYGTRYYIRIDRIDFSDGSHSEKCPGVVDLWPIEADGLGKALARKVATDYGNDVANWKAADPSPGTANP